jgi:hypothetical protein
MLRAELGSRQNGGDAPEKRAHPIPVVAPGFLRLPMRRVIVAIVLPEPLLAPHRFAERVNLLLRRLSHPMGIVWRRGVPLPRGVNHGLVGFAQLFAHHFLVPSK